MADMLGMTPFGEEVDGSDATPLLQDEWRRIFSLVTGVAGDFTGGSLEVTADGSGTEIEVAPGAFVIQGHLGYLTSAQTLDVAAVGSAPSSGQTRIDRVVVGLRPATKTVEVIVKPGTPASSGAEAAALTQSTTGEWEQDLAVIFRTGNVAVTQGMISDRRAWIGPSVTVPAYSARPVLPLGSTMHVESGAIHRRQLVGGTPQWVEAIEDTGWSSTTPSGWSGTVRRRRRGGWVTISVDLVTTSQGSSLRSAGSVNFGGASGFAPAHSLHAAAKVGQFSTGQINVGSNGNLSITSTAFESNSAVGVVATITYPV